MKILSWNVNGLKNIINNGLEQIISNLNADIICIQETRSKEKVEGLELENYYTYFNYSKKGGYSGVAIFTKKQPERVIKGIKIIDEDEEVIDLDEEARVLALEYDQFFIVTVYFPCMPKNINQIQDRMEFDDDFYNYIVELNNIKDVIICGDFNICNKDIDICNLEKHRKTEEFADEVKANFEELLNIGLIDTFRFLHPDTHKYSFWTNEVIDRKNSTLGWRLDYILVSNFLKEQIREANILSDIKGSDHCPIELVIEEK